MSEQEKAESRESSATRTAAGGRSGNHPVLPAERHPKPPVEIEDDPAKKDPRHERDQKVYEMAVTGQLGKVPPSEAEQIAVQARAGVPKEAIEKTPKTPKEQIDDDMRRLKEGEKLSQEQKEQIREQNEADRKRREEREKAAAEPRPATRIPQTETRKAPLTAGEQEQEPKNNLGVYKAEGKNTGGRDEKSIMKHEEKGDHII